jgi:putative PIN family toxin of toxin-antitoxin system
LDVSLLISGVLGEVRYLRDKYELGNEISWSTETAPEIRVFAYAGLGSFSVVVSDQLLEEWDDVRHRPHWNGQLVGFRGEAIDSVLHGPDAIRVSLGDIERVCRDPKDDYLIATAIAGDADFIVSCDKDLTDLGSHGRVRIVTAGEFLTELRPQNLY